MATCAFRWSEAYRVNVAEFDRQHQDLFDLINELDHALRVGEGNAVLDQLLDRLIKYSEEHFAAEESLMAQHAFPGLTTHRGEHDKFRQKMAAFLSDHKADKAGVPVSLLFFLRGWLKEHLLTIDKQYSSFLNARGVY